MEIIFFGNFSYPTGSASASRIRNLSKGFENINCKVKIISFLGIKDSNVDFDYLFINRTHKSSLFSKIKFGFKYLAAPFFLIYKLARQNSFSFTGNRIVFVVYGRNFYFLFPISILLKLFGHKIILDVVEMSILERSNGNILNPLHWDEYFGIKALTKISNFNIVISTSLRNYIKDNSALIIPVNILTNQDEVILSDKSFDVFNILYIGMFFERDDPDSIIKFVGDMLALENSKIVFHFACRSLDNFNVKKYISLLKDIKNFDQSAFIYEALSDLQLAELSKSVQLFLLTRQNTIAETNAFPTRLIESLKYNGIVLTRDMKDINLYFENDKNILFYDNDISELSRKLMMFINEPHKISEIANNSKYILERDFNSDKCASKIIEHLREIE